jgi:hypothetical protein
MSRTYTIARLAACAALLLCASAAQADTLRCESRNGSYASCNANTSGGVRLTRQLSSQGCWQNDTWGFDRNRIWVNRGCRAEFSTGSSSSNHGSNDKAAAAVAIALVGAAMIASRNDHHDDRYRDDNRYDSRYENRYDTGYSTGQYDNGYRPQYGYGGDPRRTFRCESKDNRASYCTLPFRGQVEVYKQRSSSPCQYGRSWGVERNRVWVSDGCRADFAVY